MPCAMHALLFSLLVSCGDPAPQAPAEPRPEGWYDPGISTTGAPPALQLYRMPGRYTLPNATVPPDHDPGRRFTVPLVAAKKKKYQGKLPFDVGDDGRRFAPPGMAVYLEDKALPYGVGAESWEIKGNNLVVSSKGAPPSVEVAWEGVQATVDRHQPSRAGLSPEAFVRYQVTLDDHTRDGLLLPAPTRAEWDVTIPEVSPMFEAWAALEPSVAASDRSDGAVVVLTVVHEGQPVEVGRHTLRGPSASYERWQVDLSRWKGQSVTLRLDTEPNGTPWFDYVFLGSPTVYGAPEGEARHVVVIGLDTTRPDHMSFFGYGRPTTPEFDAVLSQSAIFDDAYTPAPRTRPSFMTATTGRYPLDAVGAKTIGQVFQEHGFATGAFVANVHLQPRFGFHVGFETWTYEGARSDAADQVSQALTWLQENQGRDTYLFLHIMDPHIFYTAPSAYTSRFLTDPDPTLPETFNRWQVYQMAKQGELTDRRKKHIEDLYDGEMAYMSVHLARFFEGLDRLGGRNLVIIHNDHGEEFWEHGGYEHNHSLYAETTKGLLAIRPDRGMAKPLRIDTPATLADIAPTLFDFAGFVDVPPTDGKSLRPLLEGRGGDGWDRPLGIAHLRYGHEQWGVVWSRHKYILHTGSGQEELYDLTADPQERHDLARVRDLEPWRRKLAEAHSFPVGPGWRIFVDAGARSAPFRFELPRDPVDAGVVDPERTVESPNNQAWGEPPSRIPGEIGDTAREGAVLTWTPGHNPQDGLLYVLFDTVVDPTGLKVWRGDDPVVLTPSADGGLEWRSGRDRIRVVPGTVPVPGPGEAARMRMAQGGEPEQSTSEQQDWLEAMGYLHDDQAP